MTKQFTARDAQNNALFSGVGDASLQQGWIGQDYNGTKIASVIDSTPAITTAERNAADARSLEQISAVEWFGMADSDKNSKIEEYLTKTGASLETRRKAYLSNIDVLQWAAFTTTQRDTLLYEYNKANGASGSAPTNPSYPSDWPT